MIVLADYQRWTENQGQIMWWLFNQGISRFKLPTDSSAEYWNASWKKNEKQSSLPLSHGDTGLTSTRVSVKPRLQQGVNSYVTKSSTLHLIQFHWTHHKPKTALHIYLKPTCLISMNFLFPPKAYVHPMLNGPYVKGKNSGKLLGRTLSN